MVPQGLFPQIQVLKPAVPPTLASATTSTPLKSCISTLIVKVIGLDPDPIFSLFISVIVYWYFKIWIEMLLTQ
jgi:hypothetical protein